MAYVPDVDWDVFISYARRDDQALREGEKGWVSAFVHALKVAVGQFMGEEVEFFFDLEDAGAGFNDLEFIKKCAAGSALMVSIVSPTYCRREWTRAELDVFCARWPDSSRLLTLERLPIGLEDEPPEAIWQKNRLGFWQAVPNAKAKAPLQPSSDRFNERLLDFADRLKTRLRALRAEHRPAPIAPAGKRAIVPAPIEPGPPPPAQRTVLIAQGTDDVADAIDSVRRHLGQFAAEVRVLPTEDYPQGGKEFEKAFRKDLEEADIFVQLLGARAGRVPPDLPGGYTRFQLEAAREAGKKILQWRHAELDLESVPDEGYRALLDDPRVAVGLEEFKGRIIQEVRQRDPLPAEFDPAKVFINADKTNFLIAEDIGDEFRREAYLIEFPKFDGSSGENRLHLNKMLIECGVLVLVHGSPRPSWVASQKRLFEYVRPQREIDLDGLAVCTVPPGAPLGPELIGNEFHEIDCSAGFEPEVVRDFIVTLKQRAQPRAQPGSER